MDGVEAIYCIEICDSPSTFFGINLFEQIYLFLLLIPGMILAIFSCKLKYRVVNESKELATAIVTTAILQLIRISYEIISDGENFVQFVVGESLNISTSLLFATAVLLLLFLPKVSYILFHDN